MIRLLGGIEYLTVRRLISPLPARVDSGAQWSSISADNIFVRKNRLLFTIKDGERDVRFSTSSFQLRVSHNAMGRQERYVVLLPVSIGKYRFNTPFSLSDRTSMKYPALIGRSILNGRFIVDTSRSFILSSL